ncbi:hypothetical protein DFH06DRAFT_1325214 [Mycena polygramma]|nr:hypothetical protein DFH06DRAFT_1325214 [Mycena polygramma]
MGRKTSRAPPETSASRRREANRRYYKTHPDIREKNRARNAERRLAKKIYRRQWDPPKQPPPTDDSPSECEPASQDGILEVETAAHAALSAMYLLRVRSNNAREINAAPAASPMKEPKSLAEIAAYESSQEESSSSATDDRIRARRPSSLATTRRPSSLDTSDARAPRVHNNLEPDDRENALLEAERAARMRVVVESERSWEAIEALHEERASLGVEEWRYSIQRCDPI